MSGASGTDETLAAAPSGTDETVVASSQPETLAASAATLAPVSGSSSQISPDPEPRPDFPELAEVDPACYSLRGEVARGGMGRIVAARDRRLGRGVAIKQLLDRDAQAVARFEREVRITARLQHPAIVQVHEAGRWPSGEPFYSMQLVDGQPLDHSIAAATTLQARLALLANVIAVADALAYAHSEGVIHRDLKPGNVLVGGFGETVVIDWGLAKDLRAADGVADSLKIGPYRGAAAEGETVAGSVIGTPAYMPPEQASGERVDERADVYSLGAMLYHVLAGVPPFEGKTPTDVLGQVLDGPPRPLQERDRDIPVELIAIVEKAMAREPGERFPTANEMVRELKRFQTGQLVASHRYTRLELVRRWVRRNRAAVAVGAIAVVTLAVLATIGVAKIVEERDRANREAHVARARLDEATLERARQDLATDPSRALARLRQLSAGSKLWRHARMIAADARSRGLTTRILRGEAALHLDFSPDGSKLAAFERGGQIRVWNTTTWQDVRLALDHEDAIGMQLLADRLLWVTQRGQIRSWDLVGTRDAILHVEPAASPERGFSSAAFTKDGRRAALVQAYNPGVLVDLAGGPSQPIGRYRGAEFTPDGTALIAYDSSGMGRIDRIDLATNAITVVGERHISGLATDGTRVWVGTQVRVDAPARGEPTTTSGLEELTGGIVHDKLPGRAGYLELLPTGELVSASVGGGDTRDDAVTVTWSTIHRQLRMHGHTAHIQSLATSPDGRVASADADGTIRIWQLPRVVTTRPPAPPRELRTACSLEDRLPLGKYVTTVQAALLANDRRELLVFRKGPTLERRDLASGAARSLRISEFPPGEEPDDIRTCRIQQTANGRFVEAFSGDGWQVDKVARSRDGRKLATLGAPPKRQVVLWDLDTHRARMLGTHPDADAIAIHPDGSEIITKGSATNAHVIRWNPMTGARERLLPFDSLTAIAYSPDGKSLAGSEGRNLFVMPVRGTPGDARAVGVEGRVVDVTFSPDGKWLAAANALIQIDLWELGADTTRTLRGHTSAVETMRFEDDSTQLVTASADQTLRIWKLADGTSTVLAGLEGPATGFDFIDPRVPDDRRVLYRALGQTASDAPERDRVLAWGIGTARLFDRSTNTSRALAGPVAPVMIAFPTARGFTTLDSLGQTTYHLDDLPTDEAGLRRWIDETTTITVE